jgi:hypothetical protein
MGQAVRTRFVEERQRLGQTAPRDRTLALALLASLLCVAWLSIQHVARTVGLSPHTGAVSLQSDVHALDALSAGHLLEQRPVAAQVPEHNALETEDSESATFDPPVVHFATHFTPHEPRATPVLRFVSATRPTQRRASCALPRGPPRTQR